MQITLTNRDVEILAADTARAIHTLAPAAMTAYGIPRGGVAAALAVALAHGSLRLVDDPDEADVFIDDLIDSGETMQAWCDAYPGKLFLALIDKTTGLSPYKEKWIIFPWESKQRSEDDSIVGTLTNRIRGAGAPYFANDCIADYIKPGEMEQLQDEVERRVKHLLEGLIVDVENDHNTVGTAKRVAKMYLQEVFKGRYTPAPKVTDFPNAKGLDEMYTIGPITIRSACSHHFVPIVGRCWIGIVPGDRVIGLSKFNRIVEWIAARPQIQEEMVMQIADYIEKQIQPKGLAVVLEATHMCMTWRGVREPMESKMVTNVMRGSFRDKPEARAEFMALVK